jgi:photosystem II stability/assembly factor-like uncharacterized protein
MAHEFHWQPTNAPRASRTDDVWFLDAERGWAVNANGHIVHTIDGGATWQRQFSVSGAYLRCVGFANDQRGWVGTLAESRRLFETRDGGITWTLVDDLPAQAPPAICGLSVVNERVICASGTNMPDKPAGVIKSVDGGDTWTATDMSAHASLLVDIFFRDEQHGWVVGGKADVPDPRREDVIPVVLATDDGGETWHNRLDGIEPALTKGEWGWKIQFLTDDVGFVSLENFDDGAILKTADGGQTWTRKAVDDPQGNANLEGIGFVDEQHGWTGGWGNREFTGGFTSETHDGGETWTDANHVGKFLNRFRFIREPELVGYASGDTVYKYSRSAVPAPARMAAAAPDPSAALSKTRLPLRIPLDTPAGTDAVRIDIWDRFGRHVASPAPQAGAREVAWSGTTESGASADPGIYILRITVGEDAESRTLHIEA